MKSVEIKNLTEDFEEARSLVEGFLKKDRVPEVVVSETMLIFEAVCHNIFEQESDAVVSVSGRRRFGSSGIMLNYEGGMYISESDNAGPPTPEDMILNAYGDRIDYIYSSRFNSIRIQARRSYAGASLAYLIAVVIAVIAYACLHGAVAPGTEQALHSNILFPLETLFANALMMVGAPVTFLSLLRNLTGTYILSERESGVRRITRKTLTSSVLSVLLAIAACYLLDITTTTLTLKMEGYENLSLNIGLGRFISDLMPSDILTPFQTVSPFPLILLAVLVTYAFCSVGKYFDKLMDAIDVCYALFSRMLSIVMALLPVFTFFAILDLLLVNGTRVMLYGAGFILLGIVSLIVPAVYYMIRLATRGISIPGFARRLGPLLKENFKIASAIDAVPYNIRYCVKNYGLDRKRLETTMPVLAQVNLDGNCYLLTLIALVFITFSGTGFPVEDMFLIGMLVLVLSLGAPNQPGSCIIGMLIILHYVHAMTFVPVAIFVEVFFGTILNLMNVTGDIVTEVAEQRPDILLKR